MSEMERTQAALRRKAELDRNKPVARAVMQAARGQAAKDWNAFATFWTGIRVSGTYHGRKMPTRGGKFKAQSLVLS